MSIASVLMAIRSAFAWRTVSDTGLHRYQLNTVTGARRIMRIAGTGYQPVDNGWLETGVWTPPPCAWRTPTRPVGDDLGNSLA